MDETKVIYAIGGIFSVATLLSVIFLHGFWFLIPAFVGITFLIGILIATFYMK